MSDGSGSEGGVIQGAEGGLPAARTTTSPVSTNAETYVTSSPVINSGMFRPISFDRRGGDSSRASTHRSKAASSKVQRELEKLRLEEETLKTRMEINKDLLRLQEISLHKLNLEDEVDDAASMSMSDQEQKHCRTSDWVTGNIPSPESPPPYEDFAQTLKEKQSMENNGQNQQRGYQHGKVHLPPPPPLQSRYDRPQQYRQTAPPPTSDPISQLTEALKAVIAQPQQQMERFMACQTIGRDLPEFSGKVEEWPAFISYYHTSTKECKISNSQNLVRLQKCLKGEAREIVTPLLVSSSNVKEIIRVLEKHYGQPNTIIRMLMTKVRETPVAAEGKPESLIKLGGVVRNLVTTIKSLGKSKYLENPQLLEELVDKLPNGLRLEWAAYMVALRPSEADLTDFSNWLERVSDAAILLNRSIPTASNDKKVKQGKGKAAGKQETTMAIEDKDKKPTCLFCEKPNHKTEECRGLLKLSPQERHDWVKSKGCCFSCLRIGHSIKKCRNWKKCNQDGCTRSHHRLLHVNSVEDTGTKDKQASSSWGDQCKDPVQDELLERLKNLGKVTWKDFEKNSKGNEEMNGNATSQDPAVYLEIVPVIVFGPKGYSHEYAFCDRGSTVTLIDEQLGKQLGLQGPPEPLTMRWLEGTKVSENESRRVVMGIKGKFEKEAHYVRNVRTVKNLTLRIQTVNMDKLKRRWKHLKSLPISNMKDAKPRILIGNDNVDLIISREIREGPKNAPLASRSKLGWSIVGRQGMMRGRVDTNFIFCADEEKDEDRVLHELVKSSFSLDAIGITVTNNTMKSRQDARAEEMMKKHTRKVGGHYEVPLLWKDDNPCLPNNHSTAMKRLMQIEKKMDRDSEFANAYCKKIQYYLDVGYARKLTMVEAAKVDDRTWYLPHFFAYHPNKPGKPRLVFDAASEHNGISLNKKLVSGPDILKSLPGVIMKFRKKKVAFIADIEEMFHQVKIRKGDQNAQRFLWRGMDRKKPVEILVLKVMMFGATCSPYEAQYVKNENALEYKEAYPAAVESILNDHYVDDLADGADSDEQALQLIKELIFVHKQGGFSIKKWSCSSKAVLEKIPEELRATDIRNLEIKSDLPIERVLGLIWNPNEDCFQFSMYFSKVDKDIITGVRMPTKREVLKAVMSVFDPLGFLGHYTVKAKILYQQVWKSKVDWDDTILVGQQKIWKKWIKLLPQVKDLKIPRHYFENGPTQGCELHLFCDSSSEAYVSIAYLRWKASDTWNVSMVCAKARVAPLKPHSIPRLELQSALVGVRLAEFIKEEQNLEITSTTYWTDAKTVILWIQSDVNRYKQYVAHRVGEILEKSNVLDWKWLPSKLNVADEATRSGPEVKLVYDSRWFKGPPFLYLPDSEWNWNKPLLEENPDEMEVKKEFCGYVLPEDNKRHLPDVKRFSSWTRLIRTTAWVRRFVQKKFKLYNEPLSAELTAKDMKWAQKQWWKQVQKECFPYEYSALEQGKPLQKESKIVHLSPFMDKDGIIRVTSRIIHSPELDSEQKQPVILDPGHEYTRLLIRQYHLWAAHQGQEYVINELRQRYWIPRVRVAVKSVWNSCLECKHRKAKPVVAEMSPLPEFRVTKPVRAFTVCGIDYFGPLTVTKFRRHEKKWVALFTCMHVRAVHLELVDSLSTDSVILAMIRMASVRGWPKTFYSDNGTNFRGASVELNKSLKELDQKRIQAELAIKEVEWKFIPPSAPHFGGTWERLVRSVKKVLGTLLKEQAPKEELLRTLLAEATNIVNSRPLTYVPNDIGDPEVITPNCFLFGTTSGAPILAQVEEKDTCLRKQWRESQRMADCFWRRWVREYLPTLTKRTKWITGTRPVKKGDIVIIVDDNATRNVWLKGVIEEVFPGRDDIIRVVDVRTKNGTFRRPVVKLCVLEGINQDTVPTGSGTAEGSMLANADSVA